MKTVLFLLGNLFISGIVFSQEDSDSARLLECENHFKKKEYEKAYNCFDGFRHSRYILYYKAHCAYAMGNQKTARKLAKKLTRKKYDYPDGYRVYAGFYKDDTSTYRKILINGLKKYPDDYAMITELVNSFLAAGEQEASLEHIEEFLTHKEDKALYFTQGYIYQSKQQDEKAIGAYKNAVRVDTAFFDGYFNLATIYYNRGVSLYDSATNILDNKKYEAIKIQADEKLEAALPFLETAHELQPGDREVLETLKTIYFRLRIQDRYEEVKQKLEGL